MNYKSNFNYDLTKSSSFFNNEFKNETSPPCNYITNSPFQKILLTNTPEMNLISVDVNQFKNRYQEGPTIPLFFGEQQEEQAEEEIAQTQEELEQTMSQAQDMFHELFGEEIQKMNQTQDIRHVRRCVRTSRRRQVKCNDFRPCLGCQRLGLSEACVDAPRKERKHRECKTPYHRSTNVKK
jgi:hypothetical protein